ncbi:MAG TPA: tail fiber protein [Ktedonobacteraceae bacterium]|jgi:microcystin-dependent protein
MTTQYTPKYALPFPQLADTPNAPRDIEALAEKLDSVISTIVNSYIPIGTLLMWGPAGNAPPGWMICDGSEKTRDLPAGPNAALYNAIGTTYGIGNGSTTFNLPDLRGRMPMGAGSGTGNLLNGSGKVSGSNALTVRSVGQWGGEEAHTLQQAELASHTHVMNPVANHNHGATGNDNIDHSHLLGSVPDGYNLVASNQAWTMGQFLAQTGSPYRVPYQGTTATNVNANVRTGGRSAFHQHATGDGGAHTPVANPTGNNSPHNNVEPFVVINFIIKYMNV